MTEGTDLHVDAQALREHCEGILRMFAVPEEQAAVIADTLVEADLRGTHSHGAHLVALYVQRLRTSALAPETGITSVRDDGATVMLDAHLGFGQVAGVHAIDLAMERARLHGLAAVTIREATHLGALAYYTRRAAEQGFFALLTQNGPAFVPPYGGLDGIFSTNPISYAMPGGDAPPIVYDVATTAVAGNKILLAKKRGDAAIPEGWATDAAGNPTTDTQAASIDHFSWFGGHKGYGIAMLVELLSGVLGDSCFGRTEHTASPLGGRDRIAKGCFFLAVDVSRFLPLHVVGERVDVLVDDIHSSRPATGHERVLVPGEIEHDLRVQRLAEGIPISPELVGELDAIAADAGLAPLPTRTRHG